MIRTISIVSAMLLTTAWIAYQVGFDNGRDAANGVCRITCEVPKK